MDYNIYCDSFEALPNSLLKVVVDNIVETVINGNDKRLLVLVKQQKFLCPSLFKHKTTLLHIAAAKGYSRCLTILFENIDSTQIVAVINTQDDDGHTPLHLASQYGHNQCCRELLRKGSKTSIANSYGDTPLHTACRYGHAGIARILISGSSDVNIQNKNGDTPLHIACAMGRKKLTKILLQAVPNIKINNFQNESPYDIAKNRSFTDITLWLNLFKEKYDKDFSTNNFEFSPYGCHNLETRLIFFTNFKQLPDVGLGKDEEYYIDLAGNLKKGPKCVTSACVCKQLLNI